jgi:conjugal transfer ATP-binding protein TraC
MDESHQSLNDEDGEFSFEIVRRTRKYKCSLVTGTQLVGDYFANAGAKAVWENSEWAVLLSQLDESIESIVEEKRLILDESAIDALKSVKMVDHEYSEVFIKGSQGYAVGRLILDPFSISLFSSKAEDTARVNDLIDKGYNLEDAVEIASSYIRVAA